MNSGLIKRLLWPTAFLIATSCLGIPWLVENGAEVVETTDRVIKHVCGVLLGLSVSWFLVRVLDVIVWTFLEKRTSQKIPRLFRDLVAASVYFTVALIITGTVLGHNVTGIWAATGVTGIVVGFAIRDMIADVFSGIAINIDQPFKIGDWIQVHPRGVDSMYGEVIEISWRSTRIRKTDNTTLILPNSLISSITLINFSQPNTVNRFSQTYVLEFGVPAERVTRVLLSAVKSVSGVLSKPAPQALIDGTTQWGVKYKVRYWLEVTEMTPRRGRHEINNKVLEQLYRSGISLAYPKEDLYLAAMPTRQLDRGRDRSTLLSRVELFESLREDELISLAAKMVERKFRQGEVLVQMNDHGSSMFILVEGCLAIHKHDQEFSDQTKVEHMEPGSFFGEMALFTGEKYPMTITSVTEAIVFEIQKEDVAILLGNRPEIAGQISQVMARRMTALIMHSNQEPEQAKEAKEDFSQHLLNRMKAIFSGLKKGMHFRD